MSDKMREEFQAWVIGHHIGASLDGEVWTDQSCEALFNKFVYDDWDVQNSWASWQASRESLVIELPPEWAPVSERDEGANEMREHCVSAIEAAGVKAKP